MCRQGEWSPSVLVLFCSFFSSTFPSNGNLVCSLWAWTTRLETYERYIKRPNIEGKFCILFHMKLTSVHWKLFIYWNDIVLFQREKVSSKYKAKMLKCFLVLFTINMTKNTEKMCKTAHHICLAPALIIWHTFGEFITGKKVISRMHFSSSFHFGNISSKRYSLDNKC